MIAVVDTGVGNIGSVLNMIRKVGGVALRASSSEDLLRAKKIVLPGVGAFDHGVSRLRELSMFEALRNVAAQKIPLLGICLGMQLLARGSEEGELEGLGLIDAELRRFAFPKEAVLPIPHVGWNTVKLVNGNGLMDSSERHERFYFTHSFHAVCSRPQDVWMTTHYGYEFVSGYAKGNIYGVQFHPEKSHKFGMRLIRRFVELQC